jgi:hypothetical protein
MTTTPRLIQSPFIDQDILAARAGMEREPNGAALAAGSPFLREVEDGRLFEALVPKVAQADLRKRIDEYLRLAEAEYTIPAHEAPSGAPIAASKAKARPQFRYARGDSDQVKAAAISKVDRLVGGALSAAHRDAIGRAVYGRAKPSEIAGITQALIDKGELDALPRAVRARSARFRVRALQRKFKIGIDCAGYVQLAFIYAYTGKDDDPPALRTGLGLHAQRTWEALRSLPAGHFTKVPIVDARTGDLFVLEPQATSGDGAWHTVIVADRKVAGAVHTFEVHASWGVDLFGVRAGGVQKRTWQHDTSTGEWWDIAPNDRKGACGKDVKRGDRTCVNKAGPYAGHRPFGMYRAKEK